jgi:hypothetical protein
MMAVKQNGWVPGSPAMPATSKEKEWIDRIIHHCHSGESGSRLRFQLKLAAAELETGRLLVLCEPILNALIQRLGWSGGFRSQLQAWTASKEASEETGVRITTSAAGEEAFEQQFGEPILDFLFEGTMPKKSSDPYLSGLLVKLGYKQPEQQPKYAVRLQVGSAEINIGEVLRGSVKAMIDSLYPIIGGDSGSAQDQSIYHLQVLKGVKDLKEHVVRISIWQLG